MAAGKSSSSVEFLYMKPVSPLGTNNRGPIQIPGGLLVRNNKNSRRASARNGGSQDLENQGPKLRHPVKTSEEQKRLEKNKRERERRARKKLAKARENKGAGEDIRRHLINPPAHFRRRRINASALRPGSPSIPGFSRQINVAPAPVPAPAPTGRSQVSSHSHGLPASTQHWPVLRPPRRTPVSPVFSTPPLHICPEGESPVSSTDQMQVITHSSIEQLVEKAVKVQMPSRLKKLMDRFKIPAPPARRRILVGGKRNGRKHKPAATQTQASTTLISKPSTESIRGVKRKLEKLQQTMVGFRKQWKDFIAERNACWAHTEQAIERFQTANGNNFEETPEHVQSLLDLQLDACSTKMNSVSQCVENILDQNNLIGTCLDKEEAYIEQTSQYCEINRLTTDPIINRPSIRFNLWFHI